MNMKFLISSLVIGIFMISSLSNVSAGEVGLWISAKNQVGHFASLNTINVDRVAIRFADKEIVNTNYDQYQKILTGANDQAILFKYSDTIDKEPVAINLQIRIVRTNRHSELNRTLFAGITLPVSNNMVMGVNNSDFNYGYGGLRFKTTDLKATTDCIDTVDCYFDNKNVFNMPGGRFHWKETNEVNYPNGRDWT